MQWTLEPGAKVINGDVCNKAIAYFRGRVITAWYNPKLPISDGPYKLCGLPGMIYAFSDQENVFNAELTSINKIPNRVVYPKLKLHGNFAKFRELYLRGKKKYDANNELNSVNPNCVNCLNSKVVFTSLEIDK